MRKLTEQEEKAMQQARMGLGDNSITGQAARFGFRRGFTAALDYTQRKLDAYAAYVAGKITLKELEEVINA